MKQRVIVIVFILLTVFANNSFSQKLERSAFGLGLNIGFPHLIGLELNLDVSNSISIRGIGTTFGESFSAFRGDLLYRLYNHKYKDFYIYGGYAYLNFLDSSIGGGAVGIGYEYNWQSAWPGLIPIFWGVEAGYLISSGGETTPVLGGASIRFHF